MSDKTRGVYEKFRVERTDGKSAPGEKHHGCAYFVLDLKHDEFALPALAVYAKACRAKHPELAADLNRVLAAHPCNCRSVGECFHIGPQTPSEAMSDLLSEGVGR